MAAKKKRTKKLTPQSLSEFKAWLSGVEEMQDDDWIPNKTQWDLILQRIGLIEESAVIQPQQPQQPYTQPNVAPNSALVPQMPVSGTAFDNAEVIGPSDIPTLTRRAPTIPPRLNVGSEKTPDIDSSAGYESSFT